MADLIPMFLQIKAYVHYKTLLFKSNKQMKLITSHIVVSFILDYEINMTIVTLSYNPTATLSSKQR